MKFSIITVTYNAEKALPRTLESVMGQQFEGVEHIFVDGASTDGTLEMLQEYKDESLRRHPGRSIIIKSERDKGLYDAMNKGLRMATGDYLVFLNAGDYYPDATTLKRIAAPLNPPLRGEASSIPPLVETKGGCAVLYGDTDIVDSDGHLLGPRRLRPPQKLTWRSFRHGMLVCHQAFYVRTDLARDILYNVEYRHSADVDWCIRVMKEAERQGLQMVNVGSTIVRYTKEGDTTQNHRASLMERFRVMRSHYGLLTTVAMHCWFVVRAVLKP